ncbi:hypothetical protein [Streptomyces ferrugineus]|uniref:hypothetical protein n=1 Tax=Streptomyces ferrugineus TaxID=1413221 RepID=UPI001D149254|nr:hypothetical protein [Streptomyces ferrugineus]
MQERTSTAGRYTRGVAAAVVAVATLILAANAGPARAAGEITGTSSPTPCYGPPMQRADPSLTTTPDPVPAPR